MQIEQEYTDYSAADLLEALETTGMPPEMPLLKVCIERVSEIRGGLLKFLEEPIDNSWEDDDPRLYRSLHAGQILIETGDRAVLDILQKWFEDEDSAELANQWFGDRLALLGEPVFLMAERIARKSMLPAGVRSIALYMLTTLYFHNPALAERVRSVLNDLLEEVSGMVTDRRREREELATALAINASAIGHSELRGGLIQLMEEGVIDTDMFSIEEMEAGFSGSQVESGVTIPTLEEGYELLAMDEELEEDTFDVDEDPEDTEALLEELKNMLREQGVREEDMEQAFVALLASVAAEVEGHAPEKEVLEVLRRSMQGSSGTQEGMGILPDQPCPCGSGRKYKHCHGKV